MRIIRRRYNKALFIVIVVVLISAIFFGYSIKMLNKPFAASFEAAGVRVFNRAVSSAVTLVLSDVEYSDLVLINTNSNGKITSLSADGIKITRLKVALAESFQDYISINSVETISIPVGRIGSLLTTSSMGPEFKFKVKPVTAAKIGFRDEFTDSGINQVRHTIFLDISMCLSVSCSNDKQEITVTDSIMIADTVIVGDVPNIIGKTGILAENN